MPLGQKATCVANTAFMQSHTDRAQYRKIDIGGAARAGANRLMSIDDQPFGASLRAPRWSKLCRLSGIGTEALGKQSLEGAICHQSRQTITLPPINETPLDESFPR